MNSRALVYLGLALCACAPGPDQGSPAARLTQPIELRLGLEHAIDEPVYHSWIPALAKLPVVTSDGDNYLVVWRDGRDFNFEQVYAARVDRSGQLLDLDGTFVGRANGALCGLDVAYGGELFFVVWCSPEAPTSSTIHAATLNRQGVVVNDPFTIGSVGTKKENVAVASNGDTFLVSWAEYSSPGQREILVARTSATAVIEPATQLTPAGFDNSAPAVASNGTGYLVAWEQRGPFGGRVVARAVAGTGAELSAPAVLAERSEAPLRPDIASDGSDYLVVWSDARNSAASGRDIYGARLNAQAAVLGGGEFAVVKNPLNENEPALLYTGAQFLVGWSDDIGGFLNFGNRISRSGEVVGTPILLQPSVDGAHGPPHLAWSADQLLVISDVNGKMVATKLDSEARVLSPGSFVLTRQINAQQYPQVFSDAGGALVVWYDNRAGIQLDYEHYARRFDAQLAPIDPEAFALAPVSFDGIYPDAVVHDGAYYLTDWMYPGPELFSTRISQSGEFEADLRFRVPLPFGDTRVHTAFDGRQGLALAQVTTNSATEVYVTRVLNDGSLRDGQHTHVISWPRYSSVAELSYGDGQYLLAWFHALPDEAYTLRALRLGLNGEPLGEPFDVAPGLVEYGQAAVAFDGKVWLTIWSDRRNAQEEGTGSDIYGTRIDAAGRVLDGGGLRLSRDARDESKLALSHDGAVFVAAWQRSAETNDLVLSRFQLDGLSGPLPVQLVAENTGPAAPNMSPLGRGTVALTYTRLIEDVDPVPRVFLRRVSGALPNGASCVDDAGCESNYCVDGVCCDTECSGQCEVCNGEGTVGRCVAVEGAPRGSRLACAGGGVCGGICDGQKRATCSYPGDTTSCARPSCGGDVQQHSTCDGAGTCVTRPTRSCAPFACSAQGCATSCSTNDECAEGHVCEAQSCVVAPTTPPPLPAEDPERDTGCSCRLGQPRGTSTAWLITLVAAAVARRVARRR